MNDITIGTGKIRMATRRQLEANRANAKRSTGPRSADGKAKSSKNSLAHGLTAQDIVIADEDPEEFERLRAGLQVDFEPTSTIELELVERLSRFALAAPPHTSA